MSVFSQPLDRAALLAYFLGGIVPLVGLILVARRFAAEALLKPALAGLILSMALLSLASFLLLQRATRQALRRAELDNRRLAELVESSRGLASPGDRDEVLDLAMGSALALTDSRAAFFVSTNIREPSLGVRAAKGEDAGPLFQRHSSAIHELAALGLPESPDPGAAVVVRGEIGDRAASAIGLGAGEPDEGSLVLVRASDSSHDPGEDGALTALAGLVGVALKNAHLRGQQRNFFTHVTNLLVSALDTHLEHQTDARRVARVANRIGRAMKLDDQQLHALHFGALLHDIGMLRIDTDGLQDNQLALETHPTIGYEMLKQIDLWRDVAPIVLHHHERWDGGGYPEQLRGDDIPLECRIIAVAEAFDTMTSTRGDRPAVPEPEALERLREAADAEFDPRVVQTLLELSRTEQTQPDLDPLEPIA